MLAGPVGINRVRGSDYPETQAAHAAAFAGVRLCRLHLVFLWEVGASTTEDVSDLGIISLNLGRDEPIFPVQMPLLPTRKTLRPCSLVEAIPKRQSLGQQRLLL
jgi:hypothetical protein